MKSRCCLVRSFRNTFLSYRINCFCAQSSRSLLWKRHKNSKKDSSFVVCGTVSSACGPVSAVSYLWLYRFRSRKKQRVNGLYPLLDSLRTVPFFIRSLTKLARVNGQILLETVLISTRAVAPLLTCKRALKNCCKKCKMQGSIS